MTRGRIKGRYIKVCKIIIDMFEIYHCGKCGTDLKEDNIRVGNIETIETTKGDNPGCYNRINCDCGNEITKVLVRSPFRPY